jgi:hypothetical protein
MTEQENNMKQAASLDCSIPSSKVLQDRRLVKNCLKKVLWILW